MIDHDIPFYKNRDDGQRCWQACIKMVLDYYLPNYRFTWKQVAEITDQRMGEPSWPMAGVNWLTTHGFETKYIELFDYSQFLLKKSDYLRERWNNEMAEYALTTDLKYQMKWTKLFIKNVKPSSRKASFSEIIDFLKDGFICIAALNYYALYNKEDYVGHYVVIKGVEEEYLIIHDPGLPGKPNEKISFERFQKAWSYPDESSNNILAVRPQP